MKKIQCLLFGFYLLISITIFSGCATIFAGGSACHSKPNKKNGEPTRQIRLVPVVLDLMCGGIWLAADFATGAIYKPCAKNK